MVTQVYYYPNSHQLVIVEGCAQETINLPKSMTSEQAIALASARNYEIAQCSGD